MSSAVVSQAGQVLREIFKIPSRAREQVGQSWRTRFWQTERSKKEILVTSLNIHRPIWIAGTAGAYTSAWACYMAMKVLRKVRP